MEKHHLKWCSATAAQIYSQDNVMEFELGKCATLTINKEKNSDN